MERALHHPVLRRRLVLLAIAALGPLLMLIAGLGAYSFNQRQSIIDSEASSAAQRMTDRVDRELSAQIQLLQLLAESPILDNGTPDLMRFQDLAQRFAARLKLWDKIILNSRDGWQVMNTSIPFGKPLPRVVDPEGHRRVIETGQPLIGNAQGPGPNSKDGLPRVSIRVPVIRDGAVKYNLVALVSLDAAGALLNAESIDPHWMPFVIDGADTVIAAPNSPQRVGKLASPRAIAARRSGTFGVYPSVAPDGTPVMTAFSRSRSTGWSAHIAIPLAIYNRPLRDAGLMLAAAAALALIFTGAFVLLLRRDIIAARQQLVIGERTARLEAMGRLTGGVAHDFNNILMVIVSGLDRMGRLTEDTKMLAFMSAMQEAAERGRALTRELLAFSRGGTAEAQRVTVDGHLQKVAPLIRHTLKDDIELTFDLASRGAAVRLDITQLDLALLNLAANARDAMPEGGKLTISTRIAAFPDRSGRKGLALAVADTGTGIAPDVMARVFEPFFTTKEQGKGTGLGLSQVYGLATSAGGLADVTSRPGEGACFTLYLPLAPAEQLAEHAVTA